MKAWTELTPEEVDALNGYLLSYCVGVAMGLDVFLDDGWEHVNWEKGAKSWHPHDDANQALEVWAAMERVEPTMFVAGGDAVIEVDGVELADADFCTAICRAYLKVRLGDANES